VGPLAGVRVLELGDRGEVAGKLLADAGAEVLRVEPPAGAASRRIGPYVGDRPDLNRSLHFAYWNTNKRGVTLDLAKADGVALWRRLVANTDVVIDAGPPGHLGGGGGAYADLERPGLIWCAITPFGLAGPWRDFAVSDLVSLALGGPMMSNGYDDHDLPPIRPDGFHSLAIGGEYATAAILTALYQRARTGQGNLIDVSIHEAVSCTTEGAFPNWEYNRRLVQRQTGRHSAPAPTLPWQMRCTDGDYVVLMGGGFPRDERTWNALIEWMEPSGANAEIKGLKYSRMEMGEAVRSQVMETAHAFVRSMTAAEAYRGGQSRHLPYGYVRRPEQNLDDPHWRERGFFLEGELAGHDGPVRYPGVPYHFSATPLELRRRAPLLGEHNHAVYAGELGYTTDQLVVLAQAGVI
jgi:crotonobetainyl-CoA:carnitine CoA-transferase CaiB-like acyl-CoA transferase